MIVLPLAALVRRLPRGEALPWRFLLVAMGMLTGGNVVAAFGGPGWTPAAEVVIALDVPVTAGASIGAVISDGRSAAGDLITRADQAMYRAKQQRRAARAPDGRAAVRSQR